jgi:hypothetical protein
MSQLDAPDEEGSAKRHIIGYWSRKLIPAETRYPVHEREFLALFSFAKKFQTYLRGVPFVAHVDNRTMEYLATQRQARWMMFMENLDFDIQYLSGDKNAFADWLSRRPDFIENYCADCKMRLSKGIVAVAALMWTSETR